MVTLSKRHARRMNSRAARKAAARRVERMERRLVLAAAVTWNPGFLKVEDASGGTLGLDAEIYADGNGWVNVADVNGVYWDGSQHNCKAAGVTGIEVDGSTSPGFGDTIDLNGVYKGPFTDASLPGNIVVKGLTGNDTIDLGGLGEIAYGGFGNDSIIGGSGNDTIYGGNGNGTEGGYDYINGMGGNDYLVAESTAGAQLYDGNGDPIPSSEVYGGSGNDYITDADAMDYLSGDRGNDMIVAGGGPNRFRDFRFFSKKVLAAGRAA